MSPPYLAFLVDIRRRRFIWSPPNVHRRKRRLPRRGDLGPYAQYGNVTAAMSRSPEIMPPRLQRAEGRSAAHRANAASPRPSPRGPAPARWPTRSP